MSFEIMSHQIKELVHIFNLVRKIQKILQKFDLVFIRIVTRLFLMNYY